MSSNNNSTLRKETSNITLNVSDISIYINVNKANNNVVMNIPLVMTTGYISFSSSLMFNLKNENISDFGKEIRWNFYNDFYFMGTGETKIVNSLNEENIYNINSSFN